MRKNLLLSAWAEVQDVGPRATDIRSGVFIVFVFINEIPKVKSCIYPLYVLKNIVFRTNPLTVSLLQVPIGMPAFAES